MSPTIEIIDDDAAMRNSLAQLLARHGFATRTFASARNFLEASASSEVGCAIVDLKLPGMSGMDLLRAMRKRGMNVPVVVITGHGDITSAVDAMKSGAVDFLEKPFSGKKLVSAIQVALKRSPARELAEHARGQVETLTDRERDVLNLLMEGLTSKGIGARLGISARTVEVYRARLLSKFSARGTADLIRMVMSLQ